MDRSGANRIEPLYRHQVEALFSLTGAFLDSNRVTVAMPTGTGKTIVAVLAPYMLNAHRVLMITPNRIISRQIDHTFATSLHVNNFFENMRSNSYSPQSGLVSSKELLRKVEDGDTLFILNAHLVQTRRTSVKVSDLPKDEFDLIIVHEAHHYPAPTWKNLIDHFENTKVLFITATPPPVTLPLPCNLQVSREAYEKNGVIRRVHFRDVGSSSERNEEEAFPSIARAIRAALISHDEEQKKLGDDSIVHQSMVLVKTVTLADTFVRSYNQQLVADGKFDGKFPMDMCRKYTGQSETKDNFEDFKKGKFRTLVVIRKAIEGFESRTVSVVAVARRCRSRVVFAQFVGRAARSTLPAGKAGLDVPALVLLHPLFEQAVMRLQYDTMRSEEDTDTDSEDDED